MDIKRIEKLKQLAESSETKLLKPEETHDNISFLLQTIKELEEIIRQFEKKNQLLSQQNTELIQEIENTKSDFGGLR